MRPLYSAAIFLNAGLLFLVQPMIAKMLLPLFGGSTSVWIVSMVFFQAVLLLGYTYAHLVSKWLKPRLAATVHLVLFAAGALTLPLGIPQTAPDPNLPAIQILWILCKTVGPTFFALSAGAPLLQRWFAGTDDKDAKDPYFLYAASNAGSMLALLAYPILVEPALLLADQTKIWAGAYGVCGVLILISVLAAQRSQGRESEELAPAKPIIAKQRLLWLAAAAIPSSLMLGATTYLTQDLAPVPLLWVIPLALYLLTFILAFSRKRILSQGKLQIAYLIVACPLLTMVILEMTRPIELIFTLHLVGFFLAAWMCHQRLASSRPDARNLTEFYFWIALGGVVGGCVNALIAPILFSDYREYPLALIAAMMLGMPILAKRRAREVIVVTAAGAITLVGALILHNKEMINAYQWEVVAIALPLCAALALFSRSLLNGATALVVYVLFCFFANSPERTLFEGRSFYGAHEVRMYKEDGKDFHMLAHGDTVHGLQRLDQLQEPQSYYHREGPLGRLFGRLAADPETSDIACLGLGAGTVAAFGKPGWKMTFYEIDPMVEVYASDPRLFTFLRDSKAEVNTVIGDGRLTIGQAPDGKYDLILLDAFSSDAVPIHLLTTEAIQIYFSKLKPNGVVCFHVSNRYLELKSVLSAAAQSLGLATLWNEDFNEKELTGMRPSEIVLLARSKSAFRGLDTLPNWTPPPLDPAVRAWTDEYSNPLAAIDRSVLLVNRK